MTLLLNLLKFKTRIQNKSTKKNILGHVNCEENQPRKSKLGALVWIHPLTFLPFNVIARLGTGIAILTDPLEHKLANLRTYED